MQSYVMLVDGCFRGHPQKVVIELHTLHVIGSQIENAVAEGKLQCTHLTSCSHITILMSVASRVRCLLAALSVLLVVCRTCSNTTTRVASDGHW